MGLYKRDQVWWMSFTYKGRRLRRSCETTSKKVAEKIYYKVVTQVAEGKWLERPAGADKSLGELLEKYFREYAVPNLSPKTAEWKRNVAKGMVEFFGDVPLNEITPSCISSYKAACRERGLAPATVNHKLGVLRHAFNLAIREWEWVSENPVIKVGRERVNNAKDRWLSLGEQSRLLDACVIYATGRNNVLEPHYWLQEIVVFALNTGMRQDEILSLRWPAVSLFRKTATVMKSKNGEKRTIPLNNRAFELLKKKAKVRNIRGDFVFPSETGTKILARNLVRAFHKALYRAGIEDFRFHDLRHTFATRLAHSGIDLYKVARLLGHKDIRMTQRYAHHYTESLRDGVEVLDKISTILAQSKEKGASQIG